jgi:hypothetical protein
MAPLERRPERKADGDPAATSESTTESPAGGETIGDAIAAKGSAPAVTTEAPAPQSS